MPDYIDEVLERIKGHPGGEELLNIVSLQDMIDQPMAKLIMEAMDRAPRLHEKSTETSGYVRRMTKAAADSELCLSCGDLLHWDSAKTGSQRLCPARNNLQDGLQGGSGCGT